MPALERSDGALAQRRFGEHFLTLEASAEERPSDERITALAGFINELKIPNSLSLAKFLTRLANVPWFNPREEIEVDQLQIKTDDYLKEIDRPSLPVILVDDPKRAIALAKNHRDYPWMGISSDQAWSQDFSALQESLDRARDLGRFVAHVGLQKQARWEVLSGRVGNDALRFAGFTTQSIVLGYNFGWEKISRSLGDGLLACGAC